MQNLLDLTSPIARVVEVTVAVPSLRLSPRQVLAPARVTAALAMLVSIVVFPGSLLRQMMMMMMMTVTVMLLSGVKRTIVLRTTIMKRPPLLHVIFILPP